MGLDDKIRHEAEEAKGKAKEALGRATGDERMEMEGQGDQASAGVKKVGDKVADAGRDLKDRLT